MAAKELLAQLHEVAANPRKQLDKYLAEGKKVVAVTYYTPQEIVHSMGLVPMGVWGADMEINEAKKYYPAFICSIMQTILELGIKGEYKGISAIIIPSLCDSLKTLGQNWKYAVKDIPFIPMTYPQNRKPDFGIKFTKAGYERVINDLTVATGAQFSEFALSESIKVYNEHNAAMRAFSEAAANADITAAERSDVFKSAWFMLPEEHTAIVKELTAELLAGPKSTRTARVLVSGILADAPGLLKIFDDNGIQIVADEVANETRQYRTDTPSNGGGGLKRLAKQWMGRYGCSLIHEEGKPRGQMLIDMCREKKADGVISCMMKFCDPEEYDQPWFEGDLKKAGYPCLTVEVDPLNTSFEQLRTRIQTFAEML